MNNSKLDKVLEGYKPIPMKRLFYPRGMQLSEEFVNAFHREYDRLVDEGINPRTLVERFGKAMKFHANETRKYHQLDEERAKLQEASKSVKKAKHAPVKKDRSEAKQSAKQETQTDVKPNEKEHFLKKNAEDWSEDQS